MTVDTMTAVYVSNRGNDGNGGLEKDGPVATVRAALEKIREFWGNKAKKDTVRIVIMDEVATDPITIDRSYPPVVFSDDPASPGGKLTLRGGGNLLMVFEGGDVTLAGVTLVDSGNKESRGVYVAEGTFTMKGGVISGNSAAIGLGMDMSGGGGVFLGGGKFTMTGGIISGNRAAFGGGVGISKGEFTMTGGIISGNSAIFGGGVDSYGTFIKRGGVIYGEHEGELANTASEGSGAALYAAVYVDMDMTEVFTDETLGEEDDWPE